MTANNENVLHHVNKMQQAFKDQVDHLRKDIKLIDEPQCKAMFETSAEVLSGLIKAFEDYKEKKEDAWKH